VMPERSGKPGVRLFKHLLDHAIVRKQNQVDFLHECGRRLDGPRSAPDREKNPGGDDRRVTGWVRARAVNL
jgi:hypothetical protein